MNQSRQIKDVTITIYDDVSVDDLHQMLDDKIITLSEYYTVMETGVLSNDKIQIYKKKNNKK